MYWRVNFVLALIFLLAADSMILGRDWDQADQRLYDIIAVGRGQGIILFATPAKPIENLAWRFREIPLSPPDGTPLDVGLSSSGTKALVIFPDGSPRVYDLTKRISGITATDSQLPQHRLIQQLFPYAFGGSICLLDDLGQTGENGCREAASAAVHEDGSVLYALKDGRLIVIAPGNGDQVELPYRIPQGSSYQLLAGVRGDFRDFLLLVEKPGAKPDTATEIIDPHLPAILARYADPIMAGLAAQLQFGGDASAGIENTASNLSEAALAALAAHLDEPRRPTEITWSFHRVKPDPRIYAPVLEFAENEPFYPSDVNIWREIRQTARGASREAYAEAYASLGDRSWSRCTSYVRTLSYPGTWLIQYWFYYPFDEGKPNFHIHDSEHIFVEVDKLGGTVRNVFGSSHNSYIPNNIFSTLVEDAPPVTLPLHAMVEFGKHAMAPDINGDGRFTRGLDDNLHRESYAVWGVRDRSNSLEVLMQPYRASMSLPRNRENRFALKDAAALFPDLDVPAKHQVCRLQLFPDDPPGSNGDTATAEAGTAHLANHLDAVVPENIYKHYVLPYREMRLGVSFFNWSEGRGEFSLAYVGDFRHMTAGFVPIPARLGIEYSWNPFDRWVPINLGRKGQYVYAETTIKAGIRIERPVTSTQGFYFSVTPKWVSTRARYINGVISYADPHWKYGGISYHAGYVLELPSARNGNFINHIGILIRNAEHPVIFEWRVSLGFLRQRGRRDFGARVGDRNPYR